MAGEKNFIVKNGLSVGTADVLDSSGDLTAAAFGTAAKEAIDDQVNALLTAGSGIGIAYNDGAGTLTITRDAETGDISSVTAGDGLSGGGSTGAVTVALDLNELTAAAVDASADSIAIIDGSDNSSKKESLVDLGTAMAGDGLTSASGALAVGVDDSSIETNADALRVKAGGVTNAMLANSGITVSDGSNSTARALGTTITYAAGEGLDVLESAGTVTFTAETATETNMGVATFDGTDFTVSGGDVTVNAERIQDLVGAMVGSNTESGITVAYQDGDGTIDFTVGTLNQNTTGTADNVTVTANNSANETVYPLFVDGATGSQGAESDTGLTYNPSTGVITATQFTGNVTGTLTGTASSIANHDSDDLTEGSSNLYHTTARARATVSVTDAGGDGSLAYNSTSGVITYTGGSAAETRAHLSAGTGVTYSGGAISIGQAVATSSDVTFADLILTGDLTVNGATVTNSATNTTIEDALIELGSGNTGANSNDLGLILERGSTGNNAFMGWDESADSFVLGTTTDTGASTGNLTIATAALSVGATTITNATNAGGTARNVYQSTSAPAGGDGAIGDLWILYS